MVCQTEKKKEPSHSYYKQEREVSDFPCSVSESMKS